MFMQTKPVISGATKNSVGVKLGIPDLFYKVVSEVWGFMNESFLCLSTALSVAGP
jgi:hypothetical protein